MWIVLKVRKWKLDGSTDSTVPSSVQADCLHSVTHMSLISVAPCFRYIIPDGHLYHYKLRRLVLCITEPVTSDFTGMLWVPDEGPAPEGEPWGAWCRVWQKIVTKKDKLVCYYRVITRARYYYPWARYDDPLARCFDPWARRCDLWVWGCGLTIIPRGRTVILRGRTVIH